MSDACETIRQSYRSSGVPERQTDIESGETWVPCHDSINLRTFWYRPKGAGPFPVIVQRSCYPQGEDSYRTHGQELAKRGYGYICQFCRGTGGSEGMWEPNVNEADDGADFIRWVNALSWVSDIGYWGCSYLANTGWAITGVLPEKVRSMLLSHYGTERFTSAYQSGMFRHDILTAWAMGNAGRPIDADYQTSCLYRPHNRVDEALWGGALPWYREWVSNPHRSDPYWQKGYWGFLAGAPERLKVPVCIVEGWYDHHLGSAMETYHHLSSQAAAHSRLIIGCWNHGFGPCAEGKVQKNLQNNEVHQMLDWFEETLWRKELPPRRVDWYVIGADAWRHFPSYPTGMDSMSLYLSSSGALVPQAPEQSGENHYIYDPQNPIFTHGAESLFATGHKVGSLRQPEPGWRDDVLSFQSAPLSEEKTILGRIRVELYVKSDAPDTAFTARLMEVTPDGEAYYLRGSIVTLAHEEPYTPGTVRKVSMDLWDVAYCLHKGERLRLDIASSNFPEYAVHSNQAGLWSEQTETVPAHQTVLFGGDTPSRVILPVEAPALPRKESC